MESLWFGAVRLANLQALKTAYGCLSVVMGAVIIVGGRSDRAQLVE
jgi:hypothetical protein